MRIIYPDISKYIGFNCHDKNKPFYALKGFCFIVYKNTHDKDVYYIPKDFKSDGCTLKLKIFKILLGCSHTPEYLPASIIHDFLCNDKSKIDRKTASQIFKYVLIKEGVSEFKANLMYLGVEFYQKFINKWK